MALVWLHHVSAQLGTTNEGQPRLRYGQNERGEVALHDTSKYTLHLDGYNESTLTVYEFYGCLWHGRCQCYPNGRKQISKVNYATPHDLWIKTRKRRRALNAVGYVVVEMWECEWKRLKDGDKDFPA